MRNKSRLVEIFEDKKLLKKIKRKLPYLFQIAELEASRAGKIGMEVGSLREKILTALLIYKFGRENVQTEIPITEPEVDVILFGQPISIKSITGSGGVKVVWTVDAQKVHEFLKSYSPKYDILLVQINWGKIGGLFYIPAKVQQKVFHTIGRENYLKLPKAGTNPRGVEISKEALLKILSDKGTKSVKLFWQRAKVEYDPYRRWIDYWREE